MIVSLVRNSKQGRIGFVGVEHRINVLLSRAKEGMYLLGNAKSLQAYHKNTAWVAVLRQLRNQDCIGTHLEVKSFEIESFRERFTAPMPKTSKRENLCVPLGRFSDQSCRRWLSKALSPNHAMWTPMPKVAALPFPFERFSLDRVT